MGRVPRLLVPVLAATFALAAAACGGGSDRSSATTSVVSHSAPRKVDVSIYTGSVCSALATWLDNLANASAVFANTTNTEPDLEKVRAQFVTFFGGAIDETDRMVTEVEDAGVPALPNGTKVSAAMLRELGEFKPLLVDAQGRARRLPVDKPGKFTKQAQMLGAGFRIETTKLETVFDLLGKRFKAPQLTRAAHADANCRQLQP